MLRIIYYGEFLGVNITKVWVIFIGEIWLEHITEV